MKKAVLSFALPVTIVTLLAYILQSYILFTPDVGYLLTAANRLIAGGRYGTEIFETNPPMILYLYVPVCLLAKYLPIKILTIARLYTLMLLVISSGSCYLLLKKLIKPTDRFYFYSIFYTILFIYFIVALPSYLQREHILMMVLIPYLLAAALTLENKPVHPMAAVLIGLFAGIGFSLKPFFWITIGLIEAVIIIRKRNVFAWVRIESLMVMSVIVLYFISLTVFQPEYFKVMTPLVMHYYFPMIKKSWIDVMSVPHVVICLGAAMAYVLIWRQDKYRHLGLILFLGLMGMTIAFLIPGTGWFYHVLPALSLAFLLIMHLTGQAFNGKNLILWVLTVMMVLLYPLYQLDQLLMRASVFYSQNTYNQLINYINSNSGPHSLYCFTTAGTHNCFPMVYQTNSEYAERFPFFWWYKGLRVAERVNKNNPVAERIAKDKDYLIDAIADDLNRYRTRWVVVDEKTFKNYEGKDFDLIHYFSENTHFRKAWQPYRYLASIEGSVIYEREK